MPRREDSTGNKFSGGLIGGVTPGHLFIPFHYGYWDEGDDDKHERAANELTLTSWDPVSKQPYYKYAAVQLYKPGDETMAEKLGDVAGRVMDRAGEMTDKVMGAAHAERSHVADYIGLLHQANEQFIKAREYIAAHHLEEAEIQQGMKKLAKFSGEAVELLGPFTEHYGRNDEDEPKDLRSGLIPAARSGAYGLLRDLHASFIMAAEVHVTLTIVMQAAKELRDKPLLETCIQMEEQNRRQQAWLITQIEHRASHTLVVPQ